MSGRRSWNVQGIVSDELFWVDGELWLNDKKVTEVLPCLLKYIQEDAEFVIEFNSKGYYDPGSKYGGPDNLGSPPEGDDERLVDDIYILCNKKRTAIDKADWDSIEGFCREKIDNAEIDTSDPGPEYEPE